MDLRTIKKAFIDFFGGIKIYTGGIVFFGSSTYKIKGDDMRQIMDLAQIGDIFILRKDHFLSNLFIEGNFSHAGIYVGDNRVIHVTTDGIKDEDILTFMRADAFAIARPTNSLLIPMAIERAFEQLGKNVQYDYDFDKNSPEEFYCSEFTDYCYGYEFRDALPEDKVFILPDDYAETSEFFELIWKKD